MGRNFTRELSQTLIASAFGLATALKLRWLPKHDQYQEQSVERWRASDGIISEW
jgi:predicted outer membrane lipoprotein